MTKNKGLDPQIELGDNARVVLERRYLAKDDQGRLIETPEELFRRVADSIAEAEFAPDSTDTQTSHQNLSDRFFDLMASLRFLPNSPTLGNAGRLLQQLSACFVLPVEDSMSEIFETVKQTALIHQSGGGTGFSFSHLRPSGDTVASTGGVASGPVSFMKVFDAATEAIKQGGARRGANMAILDARHPDIESFIDVKTDMVTLTNFNISVAVDDEFMRAVAADESYELVNPRTGQPAGELNAREVFNSIVANAWQNGDPGLVFLDRINRDNPTPALGPMESTNPCGEQPLLPYESCNLGSLNLARFALASKTGAGDGAGIDWDGLAQAIALAVRFLDDVIEINNYPVEAIDSMTKTTRKIGLGVMGFADLLFQLDIAYDSEAALDLAGKLMALIRQHADAASEALAAERGVFPAWEQSIYGPQGANRPLRNSTRTTVAPTGTLSIIAGCSGGIEPAFALAFTRQHFLDPKQPDQTLKLNEVNPIFAAAARGAGFYSDDLIDFLAQGGDLRDREDVPDAAKRRFVTAHDIAPEWHVRMQAAFQACIDNAVSKTINFPRSATVEEVAAAYRLAFDQGCKGITIYRDGSRAGQVLSHVADGEGIELESDTAGSAASENGTPAEALTLQVPGQASAPRRRSAAAAGGRSRGRSRYVPPSPALPFSEVEARAACPDCGGNLIFAEGCLTCRSCGYTKCG